jgi:hypothetical protein
MLKKSVFIILSFVLISTLLVILLLASGCEISQSSVSEMQPSSLVPPSSSYPADIIGSVVIPTNIVTTAGYTVSAPSSTQFWIIRLSIRNKEYKLPIENKTGEAPGTGWTIVSKSDPSSIVKGRFDNGNYISIAPGQTGIIILSFMAPGGLNPNDYKLLYSGQQPVSYGSLTYDGKIVDYYDWNNQKITTSPPPRTQPKVPLTSVNPSWSHTGYVQATMIGTNYSSITFQDGFSINFVATVGPYSPPSIGGKFEVKYYFDAQRGGNIITSLSPVP